MKKLLIIALLSSLSFIGRGQSSAVQSASNYFNDKDYDHAIEYIEKALKDPSTAKEPKAWFLKGNIYLAMQIEGKSKSPKAYVDAGAAYMKVVELKPEYEKKAVSINLINIAFSYYNDGVKAFNERTQDKYTEALLDMQKVVEIHDLEVKQKYSYPKNFDTVAIGAKYVMGNCYYSLNKYDESIATLTEVKNSKLMSSADIYVHIADIYEKQNKDAERLAVIQEGRAVFPKDEALKSMEINYYIKAGKQDVLLTKLEESVKEHPDNAELWFNLGTIYMNAASPKGGTPPANAAELNAKAQQAYTNAIRIDSNNTDYNYNIGAMFFNQAVDVNEKMNDISGTSAAETKKYDGLKKQRQELFEKAKPYLEKSFNILQAKGDKMKKEDRPTYIAVMTSLRDIYAKEDKSAKALEMTKRLQNINK